MTPPPSNGEATSSLTTLEGLLFGPGGLGNGSGGGGSKKKSAAPAPPPVGGGEAGGGDDGDASPAPALRGVRKQFSLDMNVNAGGAQRLVLCCVSFDVGEIECGRATCPVV